jgi:hypothetical protein
MVAGVCSCPFLGAVCDFDMHTTLPFFAIPRQNDIALSLGGALLISLKEFFLKHIVRSMSEDQLIVIVHNLR